MLDSSPSLPTRQSSCDSILSCNVYFATSAENSCGRDACVGGDGGDGGVSSLHTRFCVIVDFRLAGFISSSGNCCPTNHKGTIVHSEVYRSICVSQRSLQCLH